MLVRPFSSVLSGSYWSSMNVSRSKTLPWPPVIRAIMSLPQRMSQTHPTVSNRIIDRTMPKMILRFLDIFFLAFLGFLNLEGLSGCSPRNESWSDGEVARGEIWSSGWSARGVCKSSCMSSDKSVSVSGAT